MKIRKYLKAVGPGVVTGAADDDPSGIATYSQTGAQYGFQFLWLSIFSLPLMAVVQEMCARIGMVTGDGMATNIKARYPKWALYGCVGLLCAASTFNIGADLGAMAAGLQLLFPHFNFVLAVVGFAVLTTFLQIHVSYKTYARYLKYLVIILFSYIVTGFIVHLNWSEAFRHTFIPEFHFSKEELLIVSAILGTTISPYLFFWQSSQEVEEEISEGRATLVERKGATHEEVTLMRLDVWLGMIISNLVMFFIIAVCGSVLFTHGVTNITSAAEAALALKPLAGDGAYVLFAVGIIGTGLLALPVLAGSNAYALAETFGWKEGLYNTWKEARAFYIVIILSMVVAVGLNFIGLNPIKALIYSAVGNGLVAPVMLFFIVHLSSDKQLMGERVNKPFTTAVGWIVVVVMIVAALATILSIFI